LQLTNTFVMHAEDEGGMRCSARYHISWNDTNQTPQLVIFTFRQRLDCRLAEVISDCDQQSMQGNLLQLKHQRREENAGAAEERTEREAWRKQTPGVQVGQPFRMAEQVRVSGKTGSHAMQGYTGTHVHIAEAQGDQKDSQCFILKKKADFQPSVSHPCDDQLSASEAASAATQATSTCTALNEAAASLVPEAVLSSPAEPLTVEPSPEAVPVLPLSPTALASVGNVQSLGAVSHPSDVELQTWQTWPYSSRMQP
jgi:hypothetical protein